MPKNNKKCCLCKEEYYYCSHCPGKSPAYMLTFCSENCREIYKNVAGYAAGDLSKEVASRELKKCDLSKVDKFTPNNKKLIKEILGEVTPAKTEVKPVVTKPVADVKPAPMAANPAQTVKPVVKPNTPEKK